MSLFLGVLLGWVPTGSWQLTELFSYLELGYLSLSQRHPDLLKSRHVVIVFSLKLFVFGPHLLNSLFEHLLSLLTFVDLLRCLYSFVFILIHNLLQFLQLLVDLFVVIIGRLILLLILHLEVVLRFSSLALLTLVILNDQVLRLDLTRRVMDHVFDDELSVTEFADAASQRVILTLCLFCSEKPGLLHAVLAAGLTTEVTVGIL